jgi:hypothetical protein
LDGVVPGNSVAEAFRVGDRQRAAGGRDQVKPAESLADGEGGSDNGAVASVAVLAGGDAGGEEGGDDSVAMFLVAREDAELRVEREVSPSVRFAIGAVELGRHVAEYLDAPRG